MNERRKMHCCTQKSTRSASVTKGVLRAEYMIKPKYLSSDKSIDLSALETSDEQSHDGWEEFIVRSQKFIFKAYFSSFYC